MASDSEKGGPDAVVELVDPLINELDSKKNELDVVKKSLRGRHESICEVTVQVADVQVTTHKRGEVTVRNCGSRDGKKVEDGISIQVREDGGKGKGRCVVEDDGDSEESDDEMDFNERMCFLESLKEQIRESQRHYHELYRQECEAMKKGEENHGKGKIIESEDDDGYDDEATDDVETLSEGEASDTEDEDSEVNEDEGGDEVLVDEGGHCSEDEDEDDNPGNELGLSDSDGPVEVRVHDEDGNPFFMLGDTYADKAELVSAIDRYAIKVGVKLKLVKSEPLRVKAQCQKGCPFVLYASRDGRNPGLKVKTLLMEHKCTRVFKNPRASMKWVSLYFKRKVQERPEYKVADMKKDLEDELKLHVTLIKCKRAKRIIMQEMEGSYVDEFNNLEAYCQELRTSNPGSDVSIEISKDAMEEGKRVFSRLYICFNASKVKDIYFNIWFHLCILE